MKRILVCGLLAIAFIGLSQDKASALCFDVYRPCIRLPLPRLPIFLPNFCIGCDTEGRQTCGGKLLYNNSYCGGQNYGYGGGCGNNGGSPYKCGTPDCNRPMYPNPGWGYNCWNGQVAPWYTYYPPQNNTGYQIGGYGNFRGPAGAGYAAPAQSRPAAYAPSYGGGYAQNIPSYWYGR